MNFKMAEMIFELNYKGCEYTGSVDRLLDQDDMYFCYICEYNDDSDTHYEVKWHFDSSGRTFDDYPDDEISNLFMSKLFGEKNPIIKDV